MNIVEISRESDASSVFAELQTLGTAWRPREDVPWLVYLDAGTLEEIARVPGVRTCWEGRCGSVARLLHGEANIGSSADPVAYAALCTDLSTVAVRGPA